MLIALAVGALGRVDQGQPLSIALQAGRQIGLMRDPTPILTRGARYAGKRFSFIDLPVADVYFLMNLAHLGRSTPAPTTHVHQFLG